MTASAADAAPAEEPAAARAKPVSPARKMILIILALLLILFTYSVLSDRFTPYTSHARVDTFLVQIAPEVAGKVIAVEARENAHVRKGEVLFRIDPEPYRIALHS